MNGTIVGIKNVDYTNKNGKQVKGKELHLVYDDNRIEGKGVKSFYVRYDFPNLDKVKLKDRVTLYFNEYKQVDFLVVNE